MSCCLVTGGAGNLARPLAEVLATRFDRLVLVDVAAAPFELPRSATFERIDLLDECSLVACFERHRPDAVVHLASLLSGSCERDRRQGWRVNVDGTFLLLETALTCGSPTVLFTSTVATYGAGVPSPLLDDAPQWPDGLYGVTKVACERLGVYYHRHHGLDFRCLRLPITLSLTAPAGAASAFASRAFVESVRSGHYTFRVRPETPLALIHNLDVVAALEKLLFAPPKRLSRRVYNIRGMTTTPREIADVIARRVPGAELCFDPDPPVADLIASWPARIDDAAARLDWGWTSTFDLERSADHLLSELGCETAYPRTV